MSEVASSLLREWLFRKLDQDSRSWIETQFAAQAGKSTDESLYIAFGLVPRRVGKGLLDVSPGDLDAAHGALPGWSPGSWSLADAGRILLLCGLPAGSSGPAGKTDFATRFRSLCRTADVNESISLYRGLALYPEPAALEPQVGEGLRTNVRSIFEAIIHHNPYPKSFFDTHRWNHMVLKALFVESRLAPIQGLDERANEELARIMRDFAHERWAAGRIAPYEIWRCVGPFARGPALQDLSRVLASGSGVEQKAAALALSASPDPDARGLLEQVPEMAADIAAGRLTWDSLR
jgi:hypothetical protein